jgi:mannose-6-phosphate isomerase-like protein (cupin superfamily)
MYHEGEGEVLMEAGDFVHHPKGHVHEILEYSEDLQLFELASPSGRHSVDV